MSHDLQPVYTPLPKDSSDSEDFPETARLTDPLCCPCGKYKLWLVWFVILLTIMIFSMVLIMLELDTARNCSIPVHMITWIEYSKSLPTDFQNLEWCGFHWTEIVEKKDPSLPSFIGNYIEGTLTLWRLKTCNYTSRSSSTWENIAELQQLLMTIENSGILDQLCAHRQQYTTSIGMKNPVTLSFILEELLTKFPHKSIACIGSDCSP